jgi:hypothetical protein
MTTETLVETSAAAAAAAAAPATGKPNAPGAEPKITAPGATQISVSRGLSAWMRSNATSLAFTSYQTGQLFLVGNHPNGTISFNQQNFTRAMGLCWQPRDGTFKRLSLDGELAGRDAEAWCGVLIVNLASGDIVEWIKLEGHITELFDVTVMPGVVCPMSVGPDTAEVRNTITFDPDQLSAERRAA